MVWESVVPSSSSVASTSASTEVPHLVNGTLVVAGQTNVGTEVFDKNPKRPKKHDQSVVAVPSGMPSTTGGQSSGGYGHGLQGGRRTSSLNPYPSGPPISAHGGRGPGTPRGHRSVDGSHSDLFALQNTRGRSVGHALEIEQSFDDII